MNNLALPHIQKMQPYKPPLDSRRDYKGLLLDFNERTQPIPEHLVKSVQKTLSKNLQVYPEYAELEKLVAAYAGVEPGQIMLTNGSDQAGEVILRTFTERDDKVVIPSPSFDMFFQNAGVIGCKIVSPLYDKSDMSFPLKETLGAIDDATKLAVVCNPNSPTGTLVSLEDIEKIAKKSPDTIIFVDEAYYEFSGVTAVSLIKKYPNIIVTRTLSKAFGLASLRIGYIVADEMYIKEMLKVRSPYPINAVGYQIAISAMQNIDYMKNYVGEIVDKSRLLIEKFFRKNKIAFYPSTGNFILFSPENPDFVFKKLRQTGILLRPQNKPNIEGSLRLTIGTFEQMERFCESYQREILS